MGCVDYSQLHRPRRTTADTTTNPVPLFCLLLMEVHMTTCTDHLDHGLLRVQEAARLLGLSRSMLYQLMDKGELPYVKFGKARRLNRQCLLEYVRRHVTGVVPAVQS